MSYGAVEPADLSEIPDIRASDFPANFAWGTATSAYQIEGALSEDGRGPSIWDIFSHTSGKTVNGETGDIADDHYHLWADDLKQMKRLNVNSYRFSTSWSRVMPLGKGALNQRGIDFYDRLVDHLLAANIDPFITLYHWDLPQALQEKGGWTNRDTAYYFAEYAEVMARKFGDRVKNWITHNEPVVASIVGNYLGSHAPGNKDLKTALQVSYNLLLSHGLAIPRLREFSPNSQVGITMVVSPTYPASTSSDDFEAAKRYDGISNRWFLDPIFGKGFPSDVLELFGNAVPEIQTTDLKTIATPIDFLGINYYTRTVLKFVPDDSSLNFVQVKVDRAQHTEMGWEIFPPGLTETLLRINKDYNPAKIYITESGAAFQDKLENNSVHDVQRLNYLKLHFAAAKEALDQGVPLAGYFIWSFLDNFEWDQGYSKRFGLIHVDYQTQQRTLKDSGLWFANFLLS